MQYLPKQNLQAERSVLGAILLSNAAIKQTDLKVEDFYRPAHQEIYKAMLSLAADGDPIDLITLGEKMESEGSLGELGVCAAEAVTPANIKFHSEIVQEASRLRKLQRMSIETLNHISNGTIETSEAIIADMQTQITQIIKNQSSMIVDMRDVARETIDYIERRHKDKGRISGVPSGFKDIDVVTDGFQSPDLIVLGARPSMGKTAFAMAIAQNAAEAGFPVGVISLEMGSQALGIRSMASLSQVELWKLRKGIIKKEEFAAIHSATQRMVSLPVYFSFSSFDLEQIRKVITQMVELKKVKMVMVDYLQLMKNSKAKTREREIGEISTTLKHTAKACGIPIIALSQLSREVEKREDKRPRLADLRDSGAIEQDADVVIFLYRDKPKDLQGTVEVHFAKGRQIGLSVVKLHFDGMTMTFR